VLAGGDDYELLFTAPAARRQAVSVAASAAGVPVTRVGVIEAESGLRLVDGDGKPVGTGATGFDHFA
jgi:thiamine-monophosphate kinase